MLHNVGIRRKTALHRDLNNVLIYSDGCSGQFKNRKMPFFCQHYVIKTGLRTSYILTHLLLILSV